MSTPARPSGSLRFPPGPAEFLRWPAKAARNCAAWTPPAAGEAVAASRKSFPEIHGTPTLSPFGDLPSYLLHRRSELLSRDDRVALFPKPGAASAAVDRLAESPRTSLMDAALFGSTIRKKP